METDVARVTAGICAFLRATLSAAGFQKLVVNVSGGVDSAVAAALAAQAVGVQNIALALMPYGEQGKRASTDAQLVIDALHVPAEQVYTFDIKRSVDAIAEQLVDLDRVRRGNVMARVRMIYLFDLAKRLGALVCGTENRTEHYLGYFTRFGDEASDIEPIRGLYKTQVRALARGLGIPLAIIEKAPTADLWEAQTDEGEFGFSYADADTVLSSYFDEHLTAADIIARGVPKRTVEQVLAHVASNDFKHHLPHVYTIDGLAIS